MRDVFISYRRSDSAGHSGRLLDALEKRFDADKFFRDIEDLAPGVDFPEALDRALAQCTAMLVVIGPTWATVATADGPRIKQPEDYVRLELAAGLARKEVRVIPVLVGGAQFPKPGELPPDLQILTRRNAFELSDSRWEFDVQRLADTLDGSVRKSLLTPKRAAVLGGTALACAAAIGAYQFDFFNFHDEDPLVAKAQREALIATANAKKATAEAEQAEAEARKRQAERASAQTDSDKAQAAAAVAKEAADKAEAERRVSFNASAAEKAKAEAEAARAAKENEEAQRVAAAKAADANAARARDEKAQAEAKALKARQDEEVATVARTADVARVAAQKTSVGASPGTLSFPRWALSSGGCGGGHVTVTGPARFSIEKTAEGVVVTEEFRGSGNGFTVLVTGKATFPKEQKSYDIQTSGKWTGSKVFTSMGIDRVNTSDGTTPRTANFGKIKTICG